VELRRALLLFAIVLGLAALASSIARPPERREGDAVQQREPSARADERATIPSATPRPGTPAAMPTTLRFAARGVPRTRRLEQGRPAAVVVAVREPAEVGIPSLGLTQPAEPLTPARFDVLVPDAGRHRIVRRPASGGPTAVAGTLAIVAAGELGARRGPR
jgi:hypothetical protein